MNSELKSVALVGYGSQARAWSTCLRKSGIEVTILLRSGSPSIALAKKDSFKTLELSPSVDIQTELRHVSLIALLLADDQIGACYTQFFKPLMTQHCFVLAHGFARYSGQLNELSPTHEMALFAPKAIGPKILEKFEQKGPRHSHDLRAAVSVNDRTRPLIEQLSRGLGFALQGWIETTFEKETIGDLISEQGLLCGTLFSALISTVNSMKKRGIPAALIREECLTEFELVASMLKTHGPLGTFRKISRAAQAGTVAMEEKLRRMPLGEAIELQSQEVVDHRFIGYFMSSKWKDAAESLQEKLRGLEVSLQEGESHVSTS